MQEFYSLMPGPEAIQKLNDLWVRVTDQLDSTISQSLVVGLGAKTLNVGVYKQFAIGQIVRITRTSDVSVFMQGTVTNYSRATGTMSVLVQDAQGSGTYTDWTVALAGGGQGPVGLQGPNGWSPILAAENDAERRVFKVVDWVGGAGVKPSVGSYIGSTGFVSTAALALDVRGGTGGVGPANTLTVGSVTQGSAAASITGVAPNQVLNLVLPKGDAATVSVSSTVTGAPGSDASVTNVGTSADAELVFVVPRGNTGLTGTAATVLVEATNTVSPGTPAAVTNTGTSSAASLIFDIPQGAPGAVGDKGWSPILATVADGARFVHQIYDWTGGVGTKPAVGGYIGVTGVVSDISLATNIRGAAGSGSGDVSGPSDATAGNLAVYADSTGKLLADGPAVSNFATAAQGTKADSAVQPDDLALVATSGSYNDLTDKPVIPSAQVNSDWSASSGVAQILNKPTLGTAAAADTGTGEANVILGNDARLSDARAPTAHTHTAAQISDSTATGRAVMTAADGAAARTAIGAGTSSFSGEWIDLGGRPVIPDAQVPADWGATEGPARILNKPTVVLEAPSDGDTYARKDAAWIKIAASGYATGDIVLSARALAAPEYLDLGAVYLQSSYPALFSVLGLRQDAVVGTYWAEVSNPFTSGQSVYAMAWGDSKFASVGDGGRVASSPDGLTWTAGSGLPNVTGRALAYGAGVWVWGGSHASVYTSTNLTAWTARTYNLGGNYPTCVHWSGALFVLAGGDGGNVCTSPDGITWTRRTHINGTSARTGLVWGASLWVMTGWGGEISTSPNGITWTARTGALNSVNAVAFGNGVFVAVGNNGGIQTSPNGTAWTVRTVPAGTGNLTAVTFAHGQFIAVGEGGAVITSADGVYWTAAAGVSGMSNLCVAGGAGAIAVGASAGRIQRSSLYSYDTTSSFVTPTALSIMLGANWKIKS